MRVAHEHLGRAGLAAERLTNERDARIRAVPALERQETGWLGLDGHHSRAQGQEELGAIPHVRADVEAEIARFHEFR